MRSLPAPAAAVAWLDKRLFRGAGDGTVIAYDARTGKKLWATAIADPKKGESVPAAPIAWNGMVFVGNAGGDAKGVRGADVRARCGQRQGRLGVLPGAEGAR